MILLDTNILSTFAKIDKLSLLFDIFQNEPVGISPNVFIEINNVIMSEYNYAETILELIKNEKIKVIAPTQEEIISSIELPKSFGTGERDSIAIAKKRGYIFVTDENRVINYCLNNSIDCLWLNQLLRILWRRNILSKEEVKKLIEDIENKDKIIIVSKEEIFTD